MQLSPKLKNKSVPHSMALKPRVGNVVSNNGSYYQNTSGINSELSNINNWFCIFKAVVPLEINKLATDVEGVNPDFYIDISSLDIPEFPSFVSVYLDINGDAEYKLISPINYNPVTKRLHGLSSPADFPNQKIKILIN